MRFMMLMIPKGYEQAAPGTMPEVDQVAEMMKYNEALRKAGVLLSLDGLHPPSMGARVHFKGGKPTVIDGPFTETKEVIGGFAILEAASLKEAVELTKRFLKVHGDEWDVECEVRALAGPEFGVEASS